MILTTKPESWIHKIVELVQERCALGDTISRAWKNRLGWSLTERIPVSLQRRLIACNEAYLELAGLAGLYGVRASETASRILLMDTPG